MPPCCVASSPHTPTHHFSPRRARQLLVREDGAGRDVSSRAAQPVEDEVRFSGRRAAACCVLVVLLLSPLCPPSSCHWMTCLTPELMWT